MAAMARRKLSTGGRVVAAGLCVGMTAALAGLMAATDSTGSASAGTARAGTGTQQVGSGTSGGSTSDGYDGSFDGDGRVGDPGDYSGTQGRVPGGFSDDGSSSGGTGSQPSFPQPQTRTGGS
jgi:hypothetical protein